MSTTVTSDHVTGNSESVGTTWTYRPSQGNTIYVSSSNRVRFRLTRCP